MIKAKRERGGCLKEDCVILCATAERYFSLSPIAYSEKNPTNHTTV